MVPRLSSQSVRSSQNSFTRAKKPEDSGEVSRPSPAASNSRSSSRCFLVRLTGVSMATSTYMSPSARSEEHTSELQSLMRISYAVFCLKKKTYTEKRQSHTHTQHR